MLQLILCIVITLNIPKLIYCQHDKDMQNLLLGLEVADSIIAENDSLKVKTQKKFTNKFTHAVWMSLKNTWEHRSILMIAPDFIGKEVQDFFKPHGNNFGWFPLFEVTSGFRPKIGTALYYRKGIYSSSVRGAVAASEKFNFELRSSLNGGSGKPYRWKLHANLLHRYDDDMWFYGIGKIPESDRRSHFNEGQNEVKGKFHQRKSRFLLLCGLRTSRNIEWFGFSQYMIREIYSPPAASSPERRLGSVFNLNSLPGATGINHQIYNELMFRYDNRLALWEMNAAFSLQSYVGLLQGVTNDNSRLLRSGFELKAFIPTLKDDWHFVPRLVLNRLHNLDASSKINFYDYSRHPAFRGVTSRLLYRSDNYTMVNSLEHRLAIIDKLTIILFFDQLYIGHDLKDFTMDNAPWALGSSLILHGRNEELARMQFMSGTAGFKGLIKFGIPTDKNHRWRWR